MEKLRVRDVVVICFLTMVAFGAIETYTWLRVVSFILIVLMVIVDYTEEFLDNTGR